MSVLMFNTDRPKVPNEIPDSELWDGKIAFVGEAPGEKEIGYRRPFMGAAGSVLNSLLKDTGLSRSRVFLGNLCPIRPPSNKLAPLFKEDHALHDELVKGITQLSIELEELKPNVIIALGELPMQVLTGKHGITKWRGSKLPCTLHGLEGTKVIPTYHPAAILRMYKWNMISMADIKFAKKESLSAELTYPERNISVTTNCDEAIAFINEYQQLPQWSFDIETTPVGGWQVLCIGFAKDAKNAFVIPFAGPPELCQDRSTYSIFTQHQEVELRRRLKKLLQNESAKCGQNGMYDRTMLAWLWDTMVLNYTDDTMLANKILYPDFPKGLDFLTSIWTDHIYYKDEGKFWKNPDPSVMKLWTQFWDYNGKDCTTTEEVRVKQARELTNRSLMQSYREVMTMQDPLLHMNLRGLRVDYQRLAEHKVEKAKAIENLQIITEGVIGRELNVKSPKQMKEILYSKPPTGMGLPPVKIKNKITTDEDALIKLSQKTSDPLFYLLMGLRKQRTNLQDLNKITTDRDNRIHYSLNVTTSTGRFACSEFTTWTGTNMQNIGKWMRDVIIADNAKDMGYSDLARAEAKVVAYLCQDADMINMFDDPDFDVHRANAARIFGVAEDQIDFDQRYLAKRVVHASNYGMGARKMAMIISKDGFPTTERECKSIQRKYFAAFPAVLRWQESIQQQLYNGRTITSATGRSRFFTGRLSDDTFRDAYAYEPQEIVCWIMSRGIENVWKYMREDNAVGLDMFLQVHDAIVWSCPKGDSEKAKVVLDKALSVPIMIKGKECLISIDHTVGQNWKECS